MSIAIVHLIFLGFFFFNFMPPVNKIVKFFGLLLKKIFYTSQCTSICTHTENWCVSKYISRNRLQSLLGFKTRLPIHQLFSVIVCLFFNFNRIQRGSKLKLQGVHFNSFSPFLISHHLYRSLLGISKTGT